MKTKLYWKKKWLEDKSGYWYSAKVPVIGWEYIIEKPYCMEDSKGFVAGTYFSKSDVDITRISSKFYKTEDFAKRACEKHLNNIANKFAKWLNNK